MVTFLFESYNEKCFKIRIVLFSIHSQNLTFDEKNNKCRESLLRCETNGQQSNTRMPLARSINSLTTWSRSCEKVKTLEKLAMDAYLSFLEDACAVYIRLLAKESRLLKVTN